ncbi:hypothetical protein CHARACLAT_002754 [Characodon lateralis]|uniref:Secreted protein n=1 Tax=Characodon lateralis TaxID=208331 RepID=A0ABU7CJY4_9TELE|nr:hypothetical protein [Characodon lateralis]
MEIFHLNNLPALLMMCLFHGASPPSARVHLKNAILHIISARGAPTTLREVCIFKKTITLHLISGWSRHRAKASRMSFLDKGLCGGCCFEDVLYTAVIEMRCQKK